MSPVRECLAMTGYAGSTAPRSPSARSFEDPDDVIELEGMVTRMVTVGGIAVAHSVVQPGWRWSEHVKPVVGTEWCQTHHVGFALSGRARIRTAAGDEYDVMEGQVFDIPPGHDGWVLGDEPWETVEWVGVRSFVPARDVLTDRVVTTLLFTDIVGSTEIARRVGEVAWGELVAVHEERVRDTLARFRGREVKATGDGVLATFDSAARAVRCAMALREVASGLSLSIRAGVHTGEVEVAESDLRGVAVHEAARIVALAGPSEVWVSAITRAMVDDPDIGFEDRGEHLLKGLPDPRRLYSVTG